MRKYGDNMSINDFIAICNDFTGVSVNNIDYIGFLHTIIYKYIDTNFTGLSYDEKLDLYYFCCTHR